MYVMKFSTSDSFIQVINENFIDLVWSMSGLELQGDNYGDDLAMKQNDQLGQLDAGAFVSS